MALNHFTYPTRIQLPPTAYAENYADLIDVKKAMMDDLARADADHARQDEQTGGMMGRGCLAEGLRTVCLSRFAGDSGGPNYRPVAPPRMRKSL